VRSHATAVSAGSSTGWANGLGRMARGATATRSPVLGSDGSCAPSLRLLVLLGALVCALSLVTSSASAALPTHPELPALSQGGFERACGVAVDSAGNRYVADATGDVVKIYSPTGTLITSFVPSVNEAGPCTLAVDSLGDVYANARGKDVVKYKPSAFPPTGSTTYGPDTSVNATGVLIGESAYGVAVDPATDDVYVPLSGQINSYQPDGTLISNTIGAGVPGAWYVGIAVRGSTGKIYAYDRENLKAYVFNPAGSEVQVEVDGSEAAAGGFGTGYHSLALDQSNGHFYLPDIGPATGHKVVDEFDGGGALVSEIATPAALADPLPAGVAVDNSGGENEGDVFVSVGINPSSVLAFGPLTYTPFFNLKVTKTGPGQGTVTSSPAGIDCGTTCQHALEEGTEVTLTAVAATGSHFSSWEGCDTVTGDECKLTMSAAHNVKAKFTAKPKVKAESVAPRDDSAQLEAEVIPNGEETSYQFEYLSEDAYQANGESFTGPEEALLAPALPESIGNGVDPVAVSAQIEGLTPGSPYRFRVVATNPVGADEGGALAFITYLPPDIFKPCANDAFRSGPGANLPDCRAYEQASPVDKNGGDLTGTIFSSKASVNGDRVSFGASVPIPGGEGAQTFTPPYLASRGSDGWSTQGLLPPQSAGQRALVAGWTADFSHVFAWATKLGVVRETTLLDRATGGGPLSAIVPHTAGFNQPQIAGTSADGSQVFFESTASIPLLQGGAPNKPNLYVWDRSTGAVRLAGVLNDEDAPPAGAFAGSYDWLRRDRTRGGAASTYFTRDQRVVSADGSKVYFTAGKSGQLYLRENPAMPQSATVIDGNGEEECTEPALACTIQVSATRRSQPDPAGTQPAIFLGASSNGERAFFTSTEMLTADAHTGPAQPAAEIGRAKLGPSEAEDPEPSFLPTHARGVALSPDGEYLYWAEPTSGTIGRAKLDPSGHPTSVDPEFIIPGETEFETHPQLEPGVMHSAQSTPRYVAVDGEYVYWTNTGPLGGERGSQLGEFILKGAGTIGRVKLVESGSGGIEPGEIEPAWIEGATNPQGIAVNSSHVYWASARDENGGGQSSIARAEIDGEGVELDFHEFSNTDPDGIALDSSHVYVTRHEGVNGYVERFPLEGSSAVETDFIDYTPLRSVAIDGSHLYWTAPGKEAIGRVSLSAFSGNCGENATCEKEFLKIEGSPDGLAISSDHEHLYWSANGEGQPNPGQDLYRFEAEGDGLTDLTPDQADPNGAEVQGLLGSSEDGSYVYFTANGVLAPGASPGDCRQGPAEFFAGACNLYLEHEGEISFVARLNASGNDGLNWRARAEKGGGYGDQSTARVSADGRTLLFVSSEKLTDYENEGVSEIYRYRVGEPSQLLCVSCNPTGLPPGGGGGSLANIAPPSVLTSFEPAATLSRNLSADGNRVFFQTDEALVVSDVNGAHGCPSERGGGNACQDVYEWEAAGTGSCERETQDGGCIYLLSTGTGADASYLLDASASGDDVFINTRSALLGQDQDSLRDVYDVRVGGGIAAQSERAAPPCEGEACRGAAAPAPEGGSPVTPLFSGPGNGKPHHKKSSSRKHKHKRHKHRRHAKSNGRTHR
jgi:sugar lactone lactonase YvrE